MCSKKLIMLSQHAKYFSPRLLLLGVASLFTMQASTAAEPISLVESTIVELVNDVKILSGDDMQPVKAEPNMLFSAPDFLQTGRRSRARLEAKDGTVTRVGANTLFSFDQSDRTINLKKGSLLFHSPSGRGGGRIVTASATASIVGTTIAVSATPDGGFKLLVLEGVAEVAFPDGTIRLLEAGQMTFVLPEQAGATIQKINTAKTENKTEAKAGKPGPVLNFDLKRLEKGSRLINGFEKPLSSNKLINTAIERQREKISSGELNSTGARIVSLADGENLVLDVSESELLNTTNDLRKDGDSVALQKLRAALRTELTPQVDGYNRAVNFFPAPGVEIPVDFAAGLAGEERAEGIIAGRLYFKTGTLDLSPIANISNSNVAHYSFRAAESVNINGNLVFILGNEPLSFVEISALNEMNIAPGSSISLSSLNPSGLLMDVSESLFDLNGISIANGQGRIELLGEQGIRINNSTITSGLGTILSDTTVSASSDLNPPTVGFGDNQSTGIIDASLLLDGQAIRVNNSQLVAEHHNFIGASQTISIDSSTVAANFIEFKAASISSSNNTFVGNQLRAIADNLISFSNNDLSALSQVQMEARTLVLSDVNFSSSTHVRLGSAMGMLAPNPNTNASAVTGYVNFIDNVMMDGLPAEKFVPVAQGGLDTGPGSIEIYSTTSTAE